MSVQFTPAALRGALTAVALAVAGVAAHAAPVVWTITGPGVTSSSSVGFDSTLAYNWDPSGFSGAWEIRGTATTDGALTFNWDWTGFHSFFRVTAVLSTTEGDVLLNEGPESCGACLPPSGGFSYDGTYTFTGLSAGDTIGFNLAGTHFDATRVMRGTFAISTVPLPGSLALAGLGLLALGAASRRRAS